MKCPYINQNCEALLRDKGRSEEDYADRRAEQCTTALHQNCLEFKRRELTDKIVQENLLNATPGIGLGC